MHSAYNILNIVGSKYCKTEEIPTSFKYFSFWIFYLILLFLYFLVLVTET